MSELIEVTTFHGHILTIALSQIESTYIPNPQLARKKASIRTKSGQSLDVAREEGVRVTMAWHAFMGSPSMTVG